MRGVSRTILVTGAGGGIGEAIARRLAKSGDHVIGTVRDPARARILEGRAKSEGLSLRFIPLEITSPEQIESVAASLEAEGGIDVLVNNAGNGVFGPVEEVDAASAKRQFDVNVFGPLALTRRLLPGLRARRGWIVFIGSLAGRIPLPFQGHYSATKASIAALSDALRMEIAPFGVKVVCVEPGDFATGFTDARLDSTRPDSPYRAKVEACRRTVERQERSAPGPDWVAQAVEDLLSMERPPARRPVGRWARTLCLAQRILPAWLRERLVLRTYGLQAR